MCPRRCHPARGEGSDFRLVRYPHLSDKNGETQICELDHLISLEVGGEDTLDSIWRQCGPSGVALPQRFFKETDTVENFLAMQVRAGRMDLMDAQRGTATDWTQFLEVARRMCPEGRCPMLDLGCHLIATIMRMGGLPLIQTNCVLLRGCVELRISR